ncbi:MAG: hypothetical protein JWN41_762 [Thermoleophilia bacterium]|nr:hypothetical protein [Thermoleophilia bacterium]
MDEQDPRHAAHRRLALPWPTERPSVQQFRNAGAGFVVPGLPFGQPPMAGASGVIGGGDPHQAYAAPAAPQHLIQPDPAAQQPVHGAQTWGFPTPHGLQLVQHGGGAPIYYNAPAAQPHPPQVQTAELHPPHAGHQPWLHSQPATAASSIVAHDVTEPAQMGRRVRWETLIPTVAATGLLVIVALVVTNFDSITGKAPARDASTIAGVSTGGAGGGDGADVALGTEAATPTAMSTAAAKSLVADARAYLERGDFETAAATLQPLAAAKPPLPVVVRLRHSIAVATKRNEQLLTRLTHQQSARQWAAALVTLRQLAALRPLSPQLAADARQARAKLLLTNSTALRLTTRRPVATPRTAPVSGGRKQSINPATAPAPPRPVSGGHAPPRPCAGGGAGTPAPPTPSGMPGMVM